MPGLQSPLHLKMLAASKVRRSLPVRLWKAIKKECASKALYGMEWGDPDVVPPLQFFKARFLDPFVRADQVGLEIGPGGGRWTRYLVGFERLLVVDYYEEALAQVKSNVLSPNIAFIKNNGTDFPGVEPASVDYAFSFGTFVHFDLDLIEEYLTNLRHVLKPTANAVIHYSDKTKIMGQMNESFSENSPDIMRRLVGGTGYRIVGEDTTSLWHSSVIRIAPQQ